MKCVLRYLACVASILIVSQLGNDARAQDSGWVSLFDGKTMTGWEKVGNPKSVWEVKDGALCGSGAASMLVRWRTS